MQLEGDKKRQTGLIKVALGLSSLLVMSLIFNSLIVAILVLIGVFIHEMGHLNAATILGYARGGIYFLPGLGAVALLKEMPEQRSKECFIALAGPFYGMKYTLVLTISYLLTGFTPIAFAVMINVIINMFNLCIPVNPLDGGRILKSIAFSIHPIVGFMMLIGSVVLSLLLIKFSWIFIFISIISIIGFIEEIRVHDKRPKMKWLDIGWATFAVIVIAAPLIWSGIICMDDALPNTTIQKESYEQKISE